MKELEKLEKLFNIQATSYSPPVEIERTPDSSDDKKESDFDFSRDTIRSLIDKNNAVIDEMISIARSAETARPFEVVGQLVKTQSEIAKDLLQLHKQKKELEDEIEKQNIKQQNNIVFAGSTSELMKMISATKSNAINVNETK